MRARIALSFGLTLLFSLGGCKSDTAATNQPAPIVDMNTGADPALANLAPVDPNAPVVNESQSSAMVPQGRTTRVLGARSNYSETQTGEQYPEGQYAQNDPAYDQYESQVDAGQQALYADQAPPELPVYEQPVLTQANDQWTPGYWSYASQGYYWVPGAWVAPPYAGSLWTPGYWGYENRRYRFHHGFWGRHIGYYGGVAYGFGYTGRGYEGGYWNGNNFYYNRNVNRVNLVDVRNVYERRVLVVNNRVSYNGPGGYNVRPQPAELAAFREQRLPPMQIQRANMQQAAQNRQQFFAENHGRPAIAVASQRFAADRALPRNIEPVQRGGFGQQGINPALNQQNVRQQQQQVRQQQQVQQQQLRTQQDQQRTQQLQQRPVNQQQRGVQAQQTQQQRVQQEQQRTQQSQQRTQQIQQHQVQNQQAQQQRAQQQQQRTQQVQQHQVQNQQEQQQRVQQQQQRTQQMQQRQVQNQQALQQRAQQQQGQQQRVQQQQVQQQQRAQQQQAQQQQRVQQQQREVARPQPQMQQRAPVTQAAPQQQRQEAPRPAPAAAPAPRPAPAPAAQPHGGGEEHGGNRPRR